MTKPSEPNPLAHRSSRRTVLRLATLAAATPVIPATAGVAQAGTAQST
jgi:hypothetical protein